MIAFIGSGILEKIKSRNAHFDTFGIWPVWYITDKTHPFFTAGQWHDRMYRTYSPGGPLAGKRPRRDIDNEFLGKMREAIPDNLGTFETYRLRVLSAAAWLTVIGPGGWLAWNTSDRPESRWGANAAAVNVKEAIKGKIEGSGAED